MRVFLFFAVFAIFYSYNNDLTTIGQELIENESFVEMKQYDITETYTVKIDSFRASSSYAYSTYALDKLFVGRYSDPYSGMTVAEPYFLISPSNIPSISMDYILDSVTFNIKYNGKMWGDTLNPTVQRLELWQANEIPVLNQVEDNFIYNTQTIRLLGHTPLATMDFLPLQESLDEVYFKLPYDFGLDLFNKMKDGSPIFGDLPWTFIHAYKGFVIKSAPQNNCIFTIGNTAEDLVMRFHFHKSEEESKLDIRLTNSEYMFNRIYNEPAPRFRELTNQEQKVSFAEAGNVAIVQGLNGYMIKMTLPDPPGTHQYTTIIKATLELNPIVLVDDRIELPQVISAYVSNDSNEIVGLLYNSSSTLVQGVFVANPTNSEDNKYVFDMTDYYQRLSSNPTPSENGHPILLSIPKSPLDNPYFETGINSTFNRVIIDEIPVLKIYLATYN